MTLVRIDGATGEGGGQVLRTAAALAARTATPLEVVNVRAGRDPPGLRPQHVAALEAVAQACQGTLDGANPGSQRIQLSPGPLTGGEVQVDTGTAANTLLILQALLPLAPELDAPLVLEATGGTDTKWAPTLGHLQDVLLPLAAKAGIRVELLDAQEGFYPRGGGRLVAKIHPRQDPAWPGVLTDRGALEGIKVTVRIAQLPDHVAERTLASTVDPLEAAGYEVSPRVKEVTAASPGVVVDAIARFEHTVIGGNGIGERGLPSERLGQGCATMLLEELDGSGTVDVHAADQLVPLLYDVPGAGYTVREATGHLSTNLSVVDRLLGGGGRIETGPDRATVRLGMDQAKA